MFILFPIPYLCTFLKGFFFSSVGWFFSFMKNFWFWFCSCFSDFLWLEYLFLKKLDGFSEFLSFEAGTRGYPELLVLKLELELEVTLNCRF